MVQAVSDKVGTAVSFPVKFTCAFLSEPVLSDKGCSNCVFLEIRNCTVDDKLLFKKINGLYVMMKIRNLLDVGFILEFMVLITK